MISERLAIARRLELTDAVESGDRIEGFFRGVKVGLEDHGLERTLRFDFGSPVKWVSIGPRGKEINDPDVVELDDAITALAHDGHAPYVSGVLASVELRAQLRGFFEKNPMARIDGRTLIVPHVAANNPDTGAAIQSGAKLVLRLREAVEAAPRVALESPPVLDRLPPPRAEVVETPQLDPLFVASPPPAWMALMPVVLGLFGVILFKHHIWTVVILSAIFELFILIGLYGPKPPPGQE